jgi:rod shape-determining protein MreC
MNPLFVRGLGIHVRLGLLALVSILLMSFDYHYRFSDPVRQGFAVIFLPFQVAGRSAVDLSGDVTDFFTAHKALQRDNLTLRMKVLRDSAELQKLRAIQQENANLRQLLGVKPPHGYRAIAAEILTVPHQPFHYRIVIDRGAIHGIENGQAVIDDQGVLGQVTRVMPASSEVTLLIDRGMAAPVEILRNGMRAMVSGTGEAGRLEVPYLSLSADIQEGDELVTSGLDGTWPRGLPVAVVSQVERRAATTFAHIVCVPRGGVSWHSHLLVLAANPDAPKSRPR